MKTTSSYFLNICKNCSHVQVQRNRIFQEGNEHQKDLKSVMGLVIMLTVLRNFTSQYYEALT